MNDYKGLTVGFIGCGNIAHFHADVLLHLGVRIKSVAFKKDRNKAELFAKKYNIERIYDSWEKVAQDQDIDCLWVVSAWDEIDKLLLPVLEYKVPTFFEKPVALSSKRIVDAINKYPEMLDKVQIGYNRRFYPFMSKLKNDLNKEKIVAVELHIPETLRGKNEIVKDHILIQNSSHLFDLLYYLLGEPYSGLNLLKLNNDKNIGYVGLFSSTSGVPITLNAVWDTPSNFRIKFYTQENRVYDLCPIEVLNVYEGIEVIEPTIEMPLRLYNPKRIATYNATNEFKFKPGFLEQSECFLGNVLSNKYSSKTPDLRSTLVITEIVKSIIYAGN